MTENRKPRIAVTMGDPAGVGPEICLQLLAKPDAASACTPIIFGDAALLARCARQTGLRAPKRILSQFDWWEQLDELDEPAVLDLAAFQSEGFEPGQVSSATGAAAYRYIETAIEAALENRVDAVSTCPINKEALKAAGFDYPGHTEIFAGKTQATRSCMMQYSDEITCTFATVHCGYAEVPTSLTTERILDVIELTHEALKGIRKRTPRIVVCGLNPHAGENGLFGNREEETIVVPAMEAARAKGIQTEGPVPPDTAFIPDKRRSTDAFVCLYHDQGHIPVKALAFDSAVNTTLGLPIIRTSVDHGTACDIAWQGKANPSSLFHAIDLATKMAAGGVRWQNPTV
jgi:4-hydroxythreonine-4-phosphate dehydrogenase